MVGDTYAPPLQQTVHTRRNILVRGKAVPTAPAPPAAAVAILPPPLPLLLSLLVLSCVLSFDNDDMFVVFPALLTLDLGPPSSLDPPPELIPRPLFPEEVDSDPSCMAAAAATADAAAASSSDPQGEGSDSFEGTAGDDAAVIASTSPQKPLPPSVDSLTAVLLFNGDEDNGGGTMVFFWEATVVLFFDDDDDGGRAMVFFS